MHAFGDLHRVLLCPLQFVGARADTLLERSVELTQRVLGMRSLDGGLKSSSSVLDETDLLLRPRVRFGMIGAQYRQLSTLLQDGNGQDGANPDLSITGTQARVPCSRVVLDVVNRQRLALKHFVDAGRAPNAQRMASDDGRSLAVRVSRNEAQRIVMDVCLAVRDLGHVQISAEQLGCSAHHLIGSGRASQGVADR